VTFGSFERTFKVHRRVYVFSGLNALWRIRSAFVCLPAPHYHVRRRVTFGFAGANFKVHRRVLCLFRSERAMADTIRCSRFCLPFF